MFDNETLNVCQVVPNMAMVSGYETRPRGYKTFSMLNSTEHGISNAHKFKYIKKFSIFVAQISLGRYFSCS